MWAKWAKNEQSEPSEPIMSQEWTEWARWAMWVKSEPSVSQEWAKSEPGVSQEWAKSADWAKWAEWTECKIRTSSWRVTGRPNDEGARSARNAQGKDILILHEETWKIIYLSI